MHVADDIEVAVVVEGQGGHGQESSTGCGRSNRLLKKA
jgi:hypothetical protein